MLPDKPKDFIDIVICGNAQLLVFGMKREVAKALYEKMFETFHSHGLDRCIMNERIAE